MAIINYAQNAEDVLLRRAFPHDDGFYIDAGANDPTFHSVTRLFYDLGWTGINIEPIPALHGRLREARPRDVNLHLGVSDSDGELPFYECPERDGWSTFVPGLAEHYRKQGVRSIERIIPVRTLARVCAEHVGDRAIDFLKVDVEGLERQVLSGADFSRWRPRVVLVENAWPDAWESVILAADYTFAACDGINRYYVRREEPALLEHFALPVSVLDDYETYEHFQLRQRVREVDGLGPASLAMARRFQRWSGRWPRLSRAFKRATRLAS